jgi:hypothetical protein
MAQTTWVGGAASCPTCWSKAGNWNTMMVPTGAVDVSIPATGNQPQLDNSITGPIDDLTVSSGATLTVDDANTLGINTANTGGTSMITNNGTITLNSPSSSAATTALALSGANGTVTLSGSGTTILHSGTAILSLSSGMTLNNSTHINGSGKINASGAGFTFNNSGQITANDSTAPLILGPVNNTGSLVAASPGQLVLGTVINTGGTINGNTGTVTLSGSNITGGTLTGTIQQNGGGSTLQGSIALFGFLNVADGNALLLNTTGGPMTLNVGATGGVNLKSSGHATDLVLTGTNGTVNLNGPVTLSNNANNRIYADNSGMTLNNSSTIQGAGQIGAATPININNTGLINANQTVPITINGTIVNVPGLSGPVPVLEATNGATLNVTGTLNNSGGNVSAGGASTVYLGSLVENNVGGTMTANGAGSTVQIQGTSIGGGKFLANPGGVFQVLPQLSNQPGSALSGTVTLDGPLNVLNGAFLRLDATPAPMTLDTDAVSGGSLNENSTGAFNDLQLKGINGVINIQVPVNFSNGNNVITTSDTGVTLNNGNTMQGAVRIGHTGDSSPFTFNNNATGTLIANLAPGITVGSISNAGVVDDIDGMTFSVDTTFGNSGVLLVDSSSTFQIGGAFTQTAGKATVNGKVTGTGSVALQGGTLTGTGTIGIPVSNTGGVFEVPAGVTLTVPKYTQGAGGTLKIDLDTNGELIVSGSGAGNVSLNGTLVVAAVKGYLPQAGTLTMLSDPNGTISGNFTTLLLPTIPGFAFSESISGDRHSVLVKVTALPPQTISFGPLSDRILGSGTFNVSATASSGLSVNFTAAPLGVCSVSGTTVTLAGEGVCAITASQPGNASYAPATPVTQTFTVSVAGIRPAAAFLDLYGAPALTFNGLTTFPDAGGLLIGPPGVTQDLNGNVYVLGLDSAGGVHLNSYNYRNSAWNGWQYSGGILDTTSGLTAAVAPNGIVWFTGRDIGNRYWINSWNGTTFGGWILVADGIFAPDSIPQIAIPSDGSIYVVGKDIGGRVWTNSYNPTNQTFTGWVDRQGVIYGQPSVTAGQDGLVYVAVRNVASESPVYIMQIPVQNAAIATTFLNGGGQIDTDPQITSQGGAVYLLAEADGNTVYLQTFSESTQTFGGWNFTNGILNDTTIAAAAGNVYIAGRDSADRIYWYSVAGNTWFFAGGAGVSSTVLSAGK